MADSSEVMRAIGQLEGKIDSVISNQQRHDTQLNGLNTRMSKVEAKAAQNGAVMGGIMGVGTTLLIASVKGLFKADGA